MNFSDRAVRFSGLLFVILLNHLAANHVYCQSTTGIPVYERVLRVEIPAKSDNETYRLIPLKDRGVILFYKSLESSGQDKSKWYFSLYDSDLKLRWTKGISISSFFLYQDFSYLNDTLSLFFRVPGKEKLVDFNAQLIRLIIKNGQFIGNLLNFPENADIVDFSVLHRMAFFGYNSKNEPASLSILKLNDGSQVTFRLSTDVSILSEFVIDSSRNQITAAIRKSISKTQSYFSVVSIDTTGKHLSETTVTSGKGEQALTSIRLCPISSTKMVAIGTYGTPSAQKSPTELQYPEETTGIYFTILEDQKQEALMLYNFLELKNIKQILGENDYESMKKKATKKNKTLNDYSASLTMLIHPLVSFGNNSLLFTGESYSPQYHTENFTDFDFYGRPFTNSYSIFDGYKFKSAILAELDFNGKLLWDNTVEIKNLITPDLSTKVTTFKSGGNLVCTYLSEGKVASKIIRADEVIEKLDFTPLELGYPNDKLLTETKSRIVPWYENYFLCCGYQEIKNISLDHDNKRLVFFFNKVRFD